MSDVVAIYAGVIGAAVGALGSQVTGVIQTISKGRARRAKAASARADEAEAKRRPLYEAMIKKTNKARVLFMQLRLTLQTGQTDQLMMAQYGEVFSTVMDQIYSCVTAIRIDGSERASEIASQLMERLTGYAEDLSAEKRLEIGQIDKMIGILKHAEDDLVQAARDDFGC